ncbi:subtilisin-like protease SBT5.6 isoform X2 [Asparagus officinalis]|nr:subtilisin-like protease SBT5.6 isoform X2 [Asparagus officinalis]
MEGMFYAFPSQRRHSLQTTRTWEFIGIEEGLVGQERDRMPSQAKYGEDVIVGVLDSGVWPESKSFADDGMGPIPQRWKGICEEGDAFNSSCCNRKLIGARYYVKDYEAYYGSLNTTYSYRSPRDGDGHGTHTASTVAGRVVQNVSALGGFARGTASGGAPLAHLAIYKVCWPIPGPNPNLENTCFDADMLAAFDDAIGDGVDIISMSIGPTRGPPLYSVDSMSIGSLHATKRGIVVACSGGNEGPDPATVVNLAPWMITVGASSIDRAFDSMVLLGSGKMIEGQTVTPYELKKGEMYPLVYAGDAEIEDTSIHVSGKCLPGSLSAEKARGKVILCFRGAGLRVEKGMEVKRAGGAAIILGNSPGYGNELVVDAHVLPGTAVSSENALEILEYINSTDEPTVMIGKANTVLGIKPAPLVGEFSSRGPNLIEPNIIKPDVTAPGLNILAAWSESSSPSKLDGDRRSVKYNIMYGTSMACPHVSATAALLKVLHPTWSSAAIKSAIMTTATAVNTEGSPITTAALDPAGPMDIGSGHMRPSHAADPGLVYDATYEDYLLFACSSINAQMDDSFRCPNNPPSTFNLNHPSLAVTGLCGAVNVTRTVTNVGQRKARYNVSVVEPNGLKVDIRPNSLTFEEAGEKKSFVITLTADAMGSGGYVSGEYSWNDGLHTVRSPILVSFCDQEVDQPFTL